MSIPIHCSNVLYNDVFNTLYDFTVSFNFTMNTGGYYPVSNNGFSVFFIDGNIPTVNGGGCGAGLGVISDTNVTTTSAVSGMFAVVGFDIIGNFFKANGLPQLTTGTVAATANSVGLRANTSTYMTYITSVVSNNPYLFGPLGVTPTAFANQTVRIGVRKNFTEIDVYSIVNDVYTKISTFQTNLTSVPTTAKFGIGYSGDTMFEVNDITINHS